MKFLPHMFKGKASPEATKRYLERREVHPGQWREFCGVPVSSLGLGTYLGNSDEVTDMKVAAAAVRAVELGCNFFDSAINYRSQRGERMLGEAMRRLVLTGQAAREELFVSTKGGFVPYDGKASGELSEVFDVQYVKTGMAKASDLIAGCHCMEPQFLNAQIERSRKNLQLQTIDLYYLHNPETQLEEIPHRIFYEKLRDAFIVMEKAVAENRIASYGMATWTAFREPSNSDTAVHLEKSMIAAHEAAKIVGHSTHSFKAIQLPFNLAMPEAALVKTQRYGDTLLSAIDAAHALGLSVAVSVPLFQARLCHNLPDFIIEKFPETLSQAQCALAFATAFPSIDAAMVGMKAQDHVEHNLQLLRMPPLSEDSLNGIVKAMIA